MSFSVGAALVKAPPFTEDGFSRTLPQARRVRAEPGGVRGGAPLGAPRPHCRPGRLGSTYVGVDWSATEIVCAVAGESGEPRPIRGATPSLSSVKDLVERARAAIGGDEVLVMIEAGAPQWIAMLHEAGAIV